MRDPDQCPICGEDTRNLNNHVRMKNDDEHGDVQTYPDGYDPDTHEYDAPDRDRDRDRDLDRDGDRPDHPEGQPDRGGGGGRIDPIDEHDDEDDDGVLEEPVDLQLGDRPSQMREYDCPDCEETVEYLDDECPNGHAQEWVVKA